MIWIRCTTSLGHYVINGVVATCPLRADFTYTTSALQAAFTDMSTDSAGTITSLDWNFGDGGSATAQHPAHSYAAGGSYTVTLAVADSAGSSAETSRIVTVTQPNAPPDAGFTYSATGTVVNFTDTSTDSDGTIASWAWNFGDGSTSVSRHPAHTYAAGGDYQVTLTVTDDGGATRIVQRLVVISGPLRAPSDLVGSVVTSGTKTKTKTVTLTWRDNSSNETAFVVQRCTETAGLAVLGQFVFSAVNGNVYSDTALSDPYNKKVALDKDFLTLPYMGGVITDSHFSARNRMGRLITFLARIVQDDWAEQALGVGIDERTALTMEPNGVATVVGTGSVYFVKTPGRPEVCQPKTKLTYQGISVYRINPGLGISFDFSDWTGKGGTAYTLNVDAGVISSTQPGGGIY